MGKWALGFALMAFAIAPCAAADDAALEAETQRWVDAVVDAAADSRDARVLMAAATVARARPGRPAPPGHGDKRDALYQRALRLGADDPLVWWVAASECPASPQLCDAPAAIARLRQLAPNNAAGWLLDAGAGDDTAANFARAAAAVRYDTYQGEHVRALHAAIATVPPPAGMVAVAAAEDPHDAAQRVQWALAVGIELAQAVPTLSSINRTCLPPTEANSGACVELAKLLAASNVLAQRSGHRILLAHLPPGPERSAVEQAQRRLDWQMAAHLEFAARSDYPAELRFWSQPGAHEASVLAAALQARGIPLDPPASWRSQRELVLPAN